MDLAAFLKIVFGDVDDEQVIGVVQRPQDGRGFVTKPYMPRNKVRDDVAIYMCISTLNKPPVGQFLQRLMGNTARTMVIVLDDIGTKIALEKFKGRLEPHYIIETSPGNFQYGFLVDLDPKEAQVLIEAFIEAGFSDPGARDVHRLVRVPGSLNFKLNPPFAGRLVEMHADEPRYTFAELVEDYGLQPREPTALRAPSKPWDGDTQGDVIFEWLTEQGMVLSEPNEEGWVFVECPWGHEHSDGRTDSKYQIGKGASGKWMCFHGACEGRHTKDLVLWCRENGAPDFDQKVAEVVVKTVGTQLAKMSRGVFSAPSPPLAPPPGASAGAILTALVLTYAPRLDRGELPSCEYVKDKPKNEQKPLAENVQYIVEACGFSVLRNHLTGEVELSHDDPAFKALTLPEERATLTRELMISLGQRIGISLRATLSELLYALAGNKGYHPILDWIESEPWDGVDRFEPMCETLVTDNPAWRNVILKRWCLLGIAAWTNWKREVPLSIPQILTLSGPQGCGKSSFYGSLLPAPWRQLEVSAHIGGVNSKDDERRILSTGLTELSEVETLIGKSDAGHIKSFASRPVDKIRLPYDRHITVRARGTLLCASVNDSEFLNDPTGARRFLPLEVKSCNWQHNINMQQFWAQIKAWFDAGESFNLTPEEMKMHAVVAEEHRVVSNSEGRLEELTARMQHVPRADWTFCTPSEICRYYGLDNNYMNSRTAGTYLRKLFGKRVSNNGRKGWYVPIKQTELLGTFSPYIPPER
jgi:putative DNA primase/helicase